MKLVSLFIGLLACASVAFSAPEKKETITTEKKTILGSGSSSLKGFSFLGLFNMADSISFSGAGGSSSATVDKGFGFGALYQTKQFSPGKFAQFGATYEMERGIQNSSVKLTDIVASGEMGFQMTQDFAITAGLNYNFPSATNLNGASIKGKMGYQFGGSMMASKDLAIDVRFRNNEYEVSANGQSATGKLSGLFLNVHYVLN